jgi:hypothetical protein
MTKIERIIDDLNNDRTIPTDALYFKRGFSFLPMAFSENFNRDLDWSVSACPEMFLMLWLEYTVEVRYNGRNYELKLTRPERKALAKAYDGWYDRQRTMHKQNRWEARQ